MNDIERKLWLAVIAETGGADTMAMMRDHDRGRSLESLGRAHGVSKQAVHKKIMRMRRKLGQYGLLEKLRE